ncbi:ZrgA family zinc uptake protein [Variovorax paradoxus]|uniref:ZrgA family zinc uptake protein n=1 Tax=Variovorax paradoxus TaxID=34073 RepID=UPI0029C7A95D|nr:DUF2796 domain-containing protein [Variovorax paradoxus]WPH18031.1 DUF2796 domain-containing protein [Variovorax paradoxus]
MAVLAGVLAVSFPTEAQQKHAHTHGRMALDVAVGAQSITLTIESPLDGFSDSSMLRAPAEHKPVADMVARQNAAHQLFQPDAAARCKLSKVELNSTALGLRAKKNETHDHCHEHDDPRPDIDVVFTCAEAERPSSSTSSCSMLLSAAGTPARSSGTYRVPVLSSRFSRSVCWSRRPLRLLVRAAAPVRPRWKRQLGIV